MDDPFKTDHLPDSGPHRTTFFLFNFHWMTCKQTLSMANEIEAPREHSKDVEQENKRLSKAFLYTAANVFAAFSVEAALNYFLATVDEEWNDDRERRASWEDKFKLVGLKKEWSEATSQLMYGKLKEIFRFRNDIAHSKSSRMVLDREMTREEWKARLVDGKGHNGDPHWFKLATQNKAETFIAYTREFFASIFPSDILWAMSQAGFVDPWTMLGIAHRRDE